jgi:hypothetical protein
MNEGPYRDQPLACPACASVLRPYHERLVCDHCGGMMLATADFAAAVGELIGAVVEHAFVDETPGERRCPRCTRAMTTCKVELYSAVHDQRVVMPFELDRCAADGLWFDPDELAEIMAAMHRKVTVIGAVVRGGVRDFWPGKR